MNVVERSARRWATELAAVRRDADPGVVAFARAVLGTAAEPGDGVLGRVIAALGAVGAAEALLERNPAERLAAAVGEAAGDLDERETATGLERWLPRLDSDGFVRTLTQATRVGARFLVPEDPEWPAGVDELGIHAPIGLWVRGRLGALSRAGQARSIALVGARAATGYGEHVAMESAAGLVDRGFAIISGGAYGIDGMAHRAALASDGSTVAFLAGGVDRFYPMGHEALLSRIVDSGAVVSELPCGAAPTKWRFLQRNRLIAASSDATVVLEAGIRSGSLNTAGHAAALGRPLGAVPGPVTSPASAGCHRLLREFDAVCVVDADQMAELAGGPGGRGGSQSSEQSAPSGHDSTSSGGRIADAPPEVTRVLDALSTRAPRELADVARRAGLSTTEVMAVLGDLDANGVVTRRPDGWRRRRTS
ncbi:DNA-processing protein DprA [Agromyces sp. Soil535]|uniref:DNA-processing protein DprA n=1 Tax=Agromyces sp. Soil535 TaxID=1736390 RepID=UPI0006FEDD40|nr:DNA-processing protein DprA [Agromyces sp. Soil535]KRE30155.1 hypothetical protein ASG80_18080 [Agromyces sp. Soil535]